MVPEECITKASFSLWCINVVLACLVVKSGSSHFLVPYLIDKHCKTRCSGAFAKHLAWARLASFRFQKLQPSCTSAL